MFLADLREIEMAEWNEKDRFVRHGRGKSPGPMKEEFIEELVRRAREGDMAAKEKLCRQ